MSAIDTSATPRDFARAEGGAVAIIFALTMIALFGGLALAVDLARAYSMSAKLSAALDAAALAGAKELDRGASDTAIAAAAEAYFNATLATTKIHGVTTSNFRAPINRSLMQVTAAVDARMATTFGRIVGIAEVNLDRSAAVIYRTRNVELSMALDITGSMASGNKMVDMQHAAKDVIDTLLEDASSEMSARVALVPWSTAVNAGTLAPSVSATTGIDSCVVERTGADAATDAYPSGPAALPAVTTSPYGWYNCPPNSVVPLSGRSKRNDLRDAVDTFTPYGGTAGHIGTAWGWYMLSPAWASLLPVDSRPHPYAPSDTIKSVLLMTDGEFNLSFLNGPATDPATMIDESYAQFQALCTAMKAQRIVVYTVGFGLSDPRALSELQTCASGTAQHFQAATGNQLRDAFRQIATQLKGMRLTR